MPELDDTTREAHELIAAVYGQISELRDNNKEATAIILPPEKYRVLQAYRSALGEVQDGLPDYLGRYDLFGIPLYTNDSERIVIRSRHVESEN